MASPAEPKNEIGALLRDLRAKRGLSLGDVAEAANISRSFLSLVETGKNDITVSRLMRVLNVLGVGIDEVLPAPPREDPSIVRATERTRVASPVEGIDVYLLTSDTKGAMMPVFMVFQPHGETAEYAQHEGEEVIHVCSGSVEITLRQDASEKTIVLHAGDTAYYKSDVPHTFKNVGSEEAYVFAVVTPPTL